MASLRNGIVCIFHSAYFVRRGAFQVTKKQELVFSSIGFFEELNSSKNNQVTKKEEGIFN